jgi:hypothetical protein
MVSVNVAAQEILRGNWKPSQSDSPSNEMNLWLCAPKLLFVQSPQRRKVPGGILAGEKGI